MAKQRHSAKGVASLLFVFLLLLRAVTVSSSSEDLKVLLEMPKFASLGSSVVITCNYNVPLQEVYKVEWHRNNKKIAQYIRERNPPFIINTLPEGYLDVYLSTEKSMVIQNVDFQTSGEFLCEVTLEKPIFSLASERKKLKVIVPQSQKPVIKFSASVYAANDTFAATCTTSPAHPAPHVTWLVNGEKIDESLITPESGHHHMRKNGVYLEYSVSNLSMPVSYLHLSTEMQINLTCLATIPAYSGPSGQYGDTAVVTAIVDVRRVEEPESPTTMKTFVEESSSAKCSIGFLWLVCGLFSAVSGSAYFGLRYSVCG